MAFSRLLTWRLRGKPDPERMSVMAKISKRFVENAEIKSKDYIIWDDDLPGFGLRVFASGKRSYVIQYRSNGSSRRYTIGLHGIWTAETARREAKVQLGRVAQGDNPAEERQADRQAMTVKELCERYIHDLHAGLIQGKRGQPKKAATIKTDLGRINGHIIPILGKKRVRDLSKADVTKMMNDIIVGKTRAVRKTENLRGKSILRGGPGAASRSVGLLGGILTYANDAGIVDQNVAHGIRKPKDRVRDRRLSVSEYQEIGDILKQMEPDPDMATMTDIVRQIALTGCRRSEIIQLRWSDVDLANSCLRLSDSKEGASIRPIGLAVIEFLEKQQEVSISEYVFPGPRGGKAYGNFPKQWKKLFTGTALEGITAHVLRHSFASIANDLGLSEITIAALLGHSKNSVTSKYVHTLDNTLVMAADTVSGYIQGLLDGKEFKQTAYAFDRCARKASLDQFLQDVTG